MTSILITAADLKDETTTELQSKFWNVAADISRMRRSVRRRWEELPPTEAALRTISNEVAVAGLPPPHAEAVCAALFQELASTRDRPRGLSVCAAPRAPLRISLSKRVAIFS